MGGYGWAVRRRTLIGAGVAFLLVAGAGMLLDVVDQPFERVILVNDGIYVLRIDDCSLDGELVPPGAFQRPDRRVSFGELPGIPKPGRLLRRMSCRQTRKAERSTHLDP